MGAEGMGDPTSDIGITWEQIAIAAVCFVVLVIVLVASLRGIGRGRRKARLLRETTREPVYRPRSSVSPARGERRVAAAEGSSRMEPSLLRSEPTTPEISLDEESPPLEPEPVPEFDPVALEQHLAYLSETQADMARTLKALKAQVDELRKAEAESNQRLDETEQMLGQLRAESHTAFALLEKIAGQTAAAPEARAPKRRRPADPSLPLDMPAAEPTDEDDPSVTRAREAIEQLARQERGER